MTSTTTKYWRMGLAGLAAVNFAALVMAAFLSMLPLASLNVVGEVALLCAVFDRPRRLWTPTHTT